MEGFPSCLLVYVCVSSVLGAAAAFQLLPQVQISQRLVLGAGLVVALERVCSIYLAGITGSVICWLAFLLLLSQSFSSRRLSVQGKAVFITGCDSGFGKTIAQHFDSMGFKVFATVLDKDGPGASELVRACSDELTLIQMDLTKPLDIENAVQFTKEKLGEKGLWGLVNNAGTCINIGDAELSLMSNYRGCMEVNFFGAITITKAFLPLIRREKGRIVNVSSPAGETPFPSFAAYGASKAALTLFTNILRQELNFWGVKVCTILPGFYKTAKVQDHAHWEQQCCNLLKNLSSELLQDYGEEYILETKNHFLKHIHFAKEDFSPVIDSITDAVLSTNPRPRYYAGKEVIIQYIILNFLPISISDLIFNRFFVQNKILPKALHK